MSFEHPCPRCRGTMLLESVHQGREVPCPHCGARFVVPAATPAPRVPPPRPAGDDSQATTALVLGILGILCCGLFGIAAWVVGNSAIERARAEGREPPGGAVAGRILGIVSVVLLAVGACVAAAYFAFLASLARGM